MEAIFFLLRVPVYLAGVVLCIFILPIDFAFLLLVEQVGTHAFIGITKTVGAPFVIVSSAWFDRNSWPRYLKEWQEAHNSVKPDWERPMRRFGELNAWLVEGPKW